jgi:ubiquinone/menaquinone biosynthesis C-methylase UbiE
LDLINSLPTNKGRILDIGAGTGDFYRLLNKKMGVNYRTK